MCGISGVIGNHSSELAVQTMLEKIKHRGPDGRNVWKGENVCLGHVRLSIIDLHETANQPMICKLSKNVIVFNGEIYNYLELKEELKKHYSFYTESDTEVLLIAYYHWGENFINKLRGMFAFALYDQNKGKTLLVRDRLGIKPLYYRLLNSQIFFCSEIKGLLNINGAIHTPHFAQLLRFISFRQLDTSIDTCFEEVKQLPQASYCWIDNDGKMGEIKKYWHLPQSLGTKIFDQQEALLLREKLTETVNFHLRSDVKIGSFMSGGLDSSAIACIAYKLLGENYGLHTFSYVLHEKNEENKLIADLQHFINGNHHELYYSGENFWEELPQLIFHHEEPLPDATMYIHYSLCRMARENNIKVLLSGNGGDEVFGGYQSHTYAFLGNLITHLRLNSFRNTIKNFQVSKYESYSNILLRTIQESTPFGFREYQKQLQLKKKRVLFTEQISTRPIQFYTSKNKEPWIANYTNYFTSWTIPPFLHYEDRNSMAFGVEVRVPFLDHELIEFVAEYRMEEIINSISKSILRKSLTGVVPQKILEEKSKHGFPAPLSLYINNNVQKSREFYYENVNRVPFLNKKEANKIAENYLVKKNDAYLNDFWRLLSVAVWYNRFFN